MTEQTPVSHQSAGTGDRIGRWAVGLVFFAAIMMLIAGTAQFFTGLAAVLGNTPFVFNKDNQLLDLSLTAWGWVHLIGGLVVGAAGAMLLSGQRWARVVAIVFVVLSAISKFLFIPQNPVWTLTIIALDVLIIWALTADGGDVADR